MKKKSFFKLFAVILALIIVAGYFSIELDTAVCIVGNKICRGECCKIDASGCSAGPCKDILEE